MNQDISILFEDLKYVKTSPPMGGCMFLWVGWWMGLSFDILIFDCLLKAPQPSTGLFFVRSQSFLLILHLEAWRNIFPVHWFLTKTLSECTVKQTPAAVCNLNLDLHHRQFRVDSDSNAFTVLVEVLFSCNLCIIVKKAYHYESRAGIVQSVECSSAVW